jgi:hypothetical protein
LEIVESHDRQAMLLQEEGGKTSYRYLSDAQKKKIRDEIVKTDPFNSDREKVEFFDKTRGMFSGLTVSQIDRFLVRNKGHYKRNSPHRSRMDEKDMRAVKEMMEVQTKDDDSGEKMKDLVEVDLGVEDLAVVQNDLGIESRGNL